MMQRAGQLALLGKGNTFTNPLVGCVIAVGDKIIGEGFHQHYGGPHAEVNAIASIKDKDRHLLSQATCYVTLEPCSHFGKTPPCADLIISSGIKSVVVGAIDPNPLVSGKGIEKLKNAGISVRILDDFPLGENGLEPFFTNIIKKRPYIIIKYARSADGFLSHHQQRVQLSNAYTQRFVHKLRSETDAILVGTSTVLTDDPVLTTRLYPGKSPVRVTFDYHNKLSSHYSIFNPDAPTLVFGKNKDLPDYVKVIDATPDLPTQLGLLLKENIGTLLVEGGAQTIQKFIDHNIWDEAIVIDTPKRLGEGIKAPYVNISPSKSIRLGTDRIHHISNI